MCSERTSTTDAKASTGKRALPPGGSGHPKIQLPTSPFPSDLAGGRCRCCSSRCRRRRRRIPRSPHRRQVPVCKSVFNVHCMRPFRAFHLVDLSGPVSPGVVPGSAPSLRRTRSGEFRASAASFPANVLPRARLQHHL
jgi:hypothetical protein